MANDGLIVDSDGKPRGIDEAIDWQLDKTVSPHRLVFGIGGKTGGTYYAVAVDAAGAVSTKSGNYAMKITASGTTYYIGAAPVGSLEADAVWQAYKVFKSGSNYTITWADGDDSFDNVGTDLTALSYS